MTATWPSPGRVARLVEAAGEGPIGRALEVAKRCSSRAIQDSRCDLPSAAFTPRDTTLGDILDTPYAHDDRITIWLIMIAGGTTTTTNRLTQM